MTFTPTENGKINSDYPGFSSYPSKKSYGQREKYIILFSLYKRLEGDGESIISILPSVVFRST